MCSGKLDFRCSFQGGPKIKSLSFPFPLKPVLRDCVERVRKRDRFSNPFLLVAGGWGGRTQKEVVWQVWKEESLRLPSLY
ncbi:hypothetical protein CDAR_90461 [Caerostris darwini]|uniref:Uncharacterized protein n=1 Tax=Caerostris darwini TaxID=1538125 RepID=A0AAV4T0H6_9ARAC|nr:hypothetical protein CDAR_90461 [Caerostris darwini]